MNDLMSADEARKRYQSGQNVADQGDWQKAVERINQAIDKGEFEVWVGAIREFTVKKLTTLGYQVKRDNDPREGTTYHISWK